MKTAVFIGGPADTRAMRIPDLEPFRLLVPVLDEPIYATFQLDTPAATPPWKAAEYELLTTSFDERTALRFYSYRETQPDAFV